MFACQSYHNTRFSFLSIEPVELREKLYISLFHHEINWMFDNFHYFMTLCTKKIKEVVNILTQVQQFDPTDKKYCDCKIFIYSNETQLTTWKFIFKFKLEAQNFSRNIIALNRQRWIIDERKIWQKHKERALKQKYILI